MCADRLAYCCQPLSVRIAALKSCLHACITQQCSSQSRRAVIRACNQSTGTYDARDSPQCVCWGAVLCCAAEGDGTKVYASCLTFYDRAPSDLCAKHEDLLGAVALKAMCLLSRQPYLASSQQVL